MMSERDDFSAFLIGFIVGGLTGAAVSLLFAPQSGEDTRALLRDKAIDLGNKASDTAEEAYTRAQETYKIAQARADELGKMAKARAEELQRKGQVIIEEQRNRISTVRKPGKHQEAVDDTVHPEA
jgi:gas vesicle protein